MTTSGGEARVAAATASLISQARYREYILVTFITENTAECKNI
jgi:hypothetical protein